MSDKVFVLCAAALCFMLTDFAVTTAQSQDRPKFQSRDLTTRGEQQVPEFDLNTVIVKPRPTMNLRRFGINSVQIFNQNEAGRLGLEQTGEITSGGEIILRLNAATLRNFTAAPAREERIIEIVRQLNEDPRIEYAQLNYIAKIQAPPSDPDYRYQWHYHGNGAHVEGSASPGGISLPQIWEQTVGSHDVVVAVLDTGLLYDHPDIIGGANALPGMDMITDSFTANDGDGRDSDATDAGDAVSLNECGNNPASDSSWHGSHVAGTVGVGQTDNAAGIAGANWRIKILPVRVLGKCGGTFLDIADGIRWAAGIPVPGEPDNPNPAKIINMSLGADFLRCNQAPAMQAAIDDAYNAGVTIFVAAGNNAVDTSLNTPSSCNNVITVAASDARGHLATRYSAYGALVDILAPGGDVERDDNGDGIVDGVLSYVKDDVALYNGTSMATPHAAGVAALLLSQQPGLSPAEVEQILKDSALPRTAVQCPHPCGAGLLSAAFATGSVPPQSLSAFWDHNGSRMELIQPGADTVEFRYKDPSFRMRRAVSLLGDLLFTGTKSGDSISGTAYVYSSWCGQKFGYSVEGGIEAGDRILLKGAAPKIQNCNHVGDVWNSNSELVFTPQ
jgi:subtilisin family serine protease